MLGGTWVACTHGLTVAGRRQEIEAAQRLKQLVGEFLDVSGIARFGSRSTADVAQLFSRRRRTKNLGLQAKAAPADAADALALVIYHLL
jgi:hypothetical protein